MRNKRALGSFGIVSVTLGIAFAIACGSSSSDDSAAGTDASNGGDTTQFPKSDGQAPKDASGDSQNIPDANLCTANPCVTQIAAAGDFTCALLADKTLRCWGQNTYGQLGVGEFGDDAGFDAAPFSVPVPTPGGTGIDEVATGDYFNDNGWTCARVGSDTRCWGNDRYAQLGLGDASAADFESALENDPHPQPSAIVGLTSAQQLSIAGGESCALNVGGTIECWGLNVDLGLGRVTTDQFSPFAAPIEGGAPSYAHVVAGEAQTCALTSTGTVDCWGWDSYNQLGRDSGGANDVTPTPVPGVSGVTQLSGGLDFYCALLSTGTPLCWGRNNSGQLGRGIISVSDYTPTAPLLPAGKKVTLMGEGQNTACALLDDDTLWCWGDNAEGEVGPDSGIDSAFDGGPNSAPHQMAGITGKIVQIAGGYQHMCVLYQTGGIACWGSNSSGQLGRGVGDGGDPDPLPHPTPAPVIF